MRYRLVSLLVATSLAGSTDVWAQPSEPDRSLAQSLFEQGKELMDGARFEEACPKLEESQRLDPGGGTLLNLALCHEKQGKIATAWTDFKGALSDAKRDSRQDRITAAEEHIAALEPQLPWLTLTVTAPVDGQEVKLDGAALGRAAWGTQVAVDPGTHQLRATAPGRKPWSTPVTMAIAENKGLAVPALEVDPAQAAPGPGAAPGPVAAVPVQPLPLEPEREKGGGGATVGWILGGVGLAALGVGTFFGIRTLAKKKDSDAQCPTDATCTPEGVKLNDEARVSAWISNIGFGLGLVGVGIGTYVIVSGGGSEERSGGGTPQEPLLAVGAWVVPGGGQVSVRGAW